MDTSSCWGQLQQKKHQQARWLGLRRIGAVRERQQLAQVSAGCMGGASGACCSLEHSEALRHYIGIQFGNRQQSVGKAKIRTEYHMALRKNQHIENWWVATPKPHHGLPVCSTGRAHCS